MERTSVKTRAGAGWKPTGESFRAFLAWLDDGTESGGESYLLMRRKLVAYFDRKNCTNPDDLADETLNRVSRRLDEEGRIESDTPAKYCYTVARFVFLEHLRSARSSEVSLDAVSENGREIARSPEADGETAERETMLSCLEKCACSLDQDQREMIFKYYHGEQRAKINSRRQLAERFGLTMNALSIRAYRIREKLEACVRQCANEA